MKPGRFPTELFGANLRRIREKRGMSQSELAGRCGLSHADISHLERGKREPQLQNLLKLVEGLEVGVDDLVAGIEWVPPADPRSKGRFRDSSADR